jgi:hypothetical protein
MIVLAPQRFLLSYQAAEVTRRAPITAAFAADHAIVDEKAARIAITETAAD